MGASAGALVAAVLSAEVHLDDATGALSRIVDSVVAAGAGPLGRPKIDILRLARALTPVQLLPEDVSVSLAAPFPAGAARA